MTVKWISVKLTEREADCLRILAQEADPDTLEDPREYRAGVRAIEKLVKALNRPMELSRR